MSNTVIKTAAIILSGGAGTRVNGNDKGLQLYEGRALIEHVIGRIKPQVDEVYICANRNLERYQTYGFKVCKDRNACSDKKSAYQEPVYQGPISGISSVLKSLLLEYSIDQVLVSSCDVPHLPLTLYEKLMFGLNQSDINTDVAIAHDGNRRQNLHCLIKRQAWQSLVDFFDDGGRAMHRWFAQANVVEVDFSDEFDCFLNINTSAQLKTNTLAVSK